MFDLEGKKKVTGLISFDGSFRTERYRSSLKSWFVTPHTNCLKWPGLGQGHGQVSRMGGPNPIKSLSLSLKMQEAGAGSQGAGIRRRHSGKGQ